MKCRVKSQTLHGRVESKVDIEDKKTITDKKYKHQMSQVHVDYRRERVTKLEEGLSEKEREILRYVFVRKR